MNLILPSPYPSDSMIGAMYVFTALAAGMWRPRTIFDKIIVPEAVYVLYHGYIDGLRLTRWVLDLQETKKYTPKWRFFRWN